MDQQPAVDDRTPIPSLEVLVLNGYQYKGLTIIDEHGHRSVLEIKRTKELH